MHVVGEDSIWYTMKVLCAYGMRSRIWKESKFATYQRLDRGKAAVRPVGTRQSDRRQLKATGADLGGSTERSTSVRNVLLQLKDIHNANSNIDSVLVLLVAVDISCYGGEGLVTRRGYRMSHRRNDNDQGMGTTINEN
ncbi:hypothetical protein [Oryza sativa Japonica Group]|uniref:Uncharacterized protein n=1 Tax=Oryza sativa subsp. japonica TaxID=39947 RepID=Q9LHX0_ORYSJ|nr:hypothetical protein [Oryza sativa Japonica Group]BAB55740.1 hypothetical protein [Oryza sativa Japonica Group]